MSDPKICLLLDDPALDRYLSEFFEELGYNVFSVLSSSSRELGGFDMVRGADDIAPVFSILQKNYDCIISSAHIFQPLNEKLAIESKRPVIFIVWESTNPDPFYLYRITGVYKAITSRKDDISRFGLMYDVENDLLPIHKTSLPIGLPRNVGKYIDSYDPKSQNLLIVHSTLKLRPAVTKNIREIAQFFPSMHFMVCGKNNEYTDFEENNILKIPLFDEGKGLCELAKQCQLLLNFSTNYTLEYGSLYGISVGIPFVYHEMSGEAKILGSDKNFTYTDISDMKRRIGALLELTKSELWEKAKFQRIKLRSFRLESRVEWFKENVFIQNQ